MSARTLLTKSVAPGTYPTAGVLVTFTAADVSNGNRFVFLGGEIIVARNTHATDAQTVTLTSAQNTRGRTKDITAQSFLAGAYLVAGPFRRKEGWAQADGSFYLAASDASVEFAIISLPVG